VSYFYLSTRTFYMATVNIETSQSSVPDVQVHEPSTSHFHDQKDNVSSTGEERSDSVRLAPSETPRPDSSSIDSVEPHSTRPRRGSIPAGSVRSPSKSVRHQSEIGEILHQRLCVALESLRQLKAFEVTPPNETMRPIEEQNTPAQLSGSIEQQLLAALEAVNETLLHSTSVPGSSTKPKGVVSASSDDVSAMMMVPRGMSVDAFGASQHNDVSSISHQGEFSVAGGLSYMQTSFTSGTPYGRELPNTRDNLARSTSISGTPAVSPKSSFHNFKGAGVMVLGGAGQSIASVANAAVGVSRAHKNRVTSVTYENVPDGNVADWLNENFAPSQRRRKSLGMSVAANSHTQAGIRSLSPALSFTAERGSSEPPPSVSLDNLLPVTAMQSSGQESGESDSARRYSKGPLSTDLLGRDAHADKLAPPSTEENLSSRNTASTPGRYSLGGHGNVALLPPSHDASLSDSGAAVKSVSPHSTSGAAARVEAATLVHFQRSMDRLVPAVMSTMDTALVLKKCGGIAMIDEVDSEDFDIFSVVNERGIDDTFLAVAANVFARYSFVSSLSLNLPKFVAFLRCLCQCYRKENLYHNAIHAADCLQTVHIFLCVNDMRENFSDIELLSVLFSAIVHDLGHLGVNNAFLNRLGHPISQLFNAQSTLESAHAAAALYIVSLPQYNFFPISFRPTVVPKNVVADTQANDHTTAAGFEGELKSLPSNLSAFVPASPMTPDMLDDFRSLVVECLLATDMKHHTDQIRIVKGMLDSGIIGDGDFTNILRSIIHVADISNPMKLYPTYVHWMSRVVAEFWVQGDAEKKRGFPISMMCDKRNTVIGKAQHGFIQFVVRPFALEMAPIMPSVWLKRLDDNAARMLTMSAEEEQEVLRSIHDLIGESEWTDDNSDATVTRLADGTPTRLVDIFQQLLSQGQENVESSISVKTPRAIQNLCASESDLVVTGAHEKTAENVPGHQINAPRPPQIGRPPSSPPRSVRNTTRATCTTPLQEPLFPVTLPPIRGAPTSSSVRPYGSAEHSGVNAMPPQIVPQAHTATRGARNDHYEVLGIGGGQQYGTAMRPQYRQLRDVVPTPQWMATLLPSPRK
jgi:hypothetical protein